MTTSKVLSGKTWKRVCHVAGFPTWNSALQFEWRFKQLTRRENSNKTPLERRKDALSKLLSLPKSTTNAIPYSEWKNGPPIVNWEE
jgi:predicted GIY-YIG superfamily endonuclease